MVLRRLRLAGSGWSEDQASQMGAALAYYTLFSLTPLLILAIAIIGSMFGEQETRETILTEIQQFVDPQSADTIRLMLDSFRSTKAGTGISIVGIISLFFGATGMFASLRSSLQRIWRLSSTRDGLIVGLLKNYLLAFLMVFVVCVFILLLLIASTLMPVLYPKLVERYPSIPWSGPWLDFAASTFLLTLLFLFTFRFLSDGRLRYMQLVFGSLVTALLFAFGKILMGYYFAYVNLGSAYGAAGSVMVFLAWVYYSAQIVFYGAEVVRFGLPKPHGTTQ